MITIDEVHNLHDLGLAHAGARDPQRNSDAIFGDLHGSTQVGDRPRILQHPHAIEDVRRVFRTNLGRETLDAFERFQP